MTELEKNKYLDYLDIIARMGDMIDEGANLYLNGKKSDPRLIAMECYLNDPDSYMRDYHIKKSGEDLFD